jgi:hypothetical protein
LLKRINKAVVGNTKYHLPDCCRFADIVQAAGANYITQFSVPSSWSCGSALLMSLGAVQIIPNTLTLANSAAVMSSS